MPHAGDPAAQNSISSSITGHQTVLLSCSSASLCAAVSVCEYVRVVLSPCWSVVGAAGSCSDGAVGPLVHSTDEQQQWGARAVVEVWTTAATAC